MHRTDHKLQLHRIPQTHRKKLLDQIDLQEHRGEHCIKNLKERRSHLATTYGPVGLW